MVCGFETKIRRYVRVISARQRKLGKFVNRVNLGRVIIRRKNAENTIISNF